MMPQPDWLDSESWCGFCEMRAAKGRRTPFTPRAAKMILKTLAELKEAGHDPNASLDQSVRNGWSDVYEPKDRVIQKKGSAVANEWLRDHGKDEETTLEQRAAIGLMLRQTKNRLRSVG